MRLTGYIALCALIIGIILIRPPPGIPRAERSIDIASFFHDWVYLLFLFMLVTFDFPRAESELILEYGQGFNNTSEHIFPKSELLVFV